VVAQFISKFNNSKFELIDQICRLYNSRELIVFLHIYIYYCQYLVIVRACLFVYFSHFLNNVVCIHLLCFALLCFVFFFLLYGLNMLYSDLYFCHIFVFVSFFGLLFFESRFSLYCFFSLLYSCCFVRAIIAYSLFIH